MEQIEKILSGPSIPIKLIPTKVGGMRVEYKNNHYTYYFTKSSITFWRCIEFEDHKCTARVVSKDKKVYEFDGKHNHSSKLNDDSPKILSQITIKSSTLPSQKPSTTFEKHITIKRVDSGPVKTIESHETTEPIMKILNKGKVDEARKTTFSSTPSPTQPPTQSAPAGSDFKLRMQKRLQLALKGQK